MKAGVAFLAGVALALGGAYTYFKVADPRPTPALQPVVKISENTPPALPPEPSETVVETPAPKPVVHPRLMLPPKPKITSRPVSLAVATPPPVTSYQQPLAPIPDPPAPSPVIPAPAPVPVQTAPPPPPAPQPHTVTIPEGTTIAVRLNEKLSTDTNYTNDAFRATLDAPLVIDGFIIADRGAKVLGKIVKAQKPGKLEGMAELSLALTEISTTDGQRIQVETNQSLRKGPSNTNQEVMKMGGGAALGAIIGAIAGGGKGAAIGAGAGGAAGTGAVLLGHGKPAVIENETKLTFTLTNPTTITEHLN